MTVGDAQALSPGHPAARKEVAMATMEELPNDVRDFLRTYQWRHVDPVSCAEPHTVE